MRSHCLRAGVVARCLVVLLLMGSASGCVGLAAQVLYMVKGEKVPAEFEGLEGKRVAVVCVAGSGNYGPGSAPSVLSQLVEAILRNQVKNIKVVRHEEVIDWIDNNDWNQMDYRDVGRGVNADMVVGLDLDGYRLHEDATMYKGRASVTITVYDMKKGGESVYRDTMPNFMFPVNGGQHVSETNEAQFQRKFLLILAQDIAKHFYAYEFKDEFARDAVLMHQ